MSFGRVVCRILPVALLTLPLVSCSGSPPDSPVLTADVPLHLEDHLDVAVITGSAAPDTPPEAIAWLLEEGPGDWKPYVPRDPVRGPLSIEDIEDGIRLRLTESTGFTRDDGSRSYRGALYVDLPDWNREDWAYVVIRARTSDDIGAIEIAHNLREASDTLGSFQHSGEWIDVISDGAIHSYVMRADWSYEFGGDHWEGPWRQLGVSIGSDEPASLDLLSISVIPKAARYADAPAGVANEVRGGRSRDCGRGRRTSRSRTAPASA